MCDAGGCVGGWQFASEGNNKWGEAVDSNRYLVRLWEGELKLQGKPKLDVENSHELNFSHMENTSHS